jgi:hypothetical protein
MGSDKILERNFQKASQACFLRKKIKLGRGSGRTRFSSLGEINKTLIHKM